VTSRERVRLALSHREPNRVPFDLGSRSSTIEEQPCIELKRHLGIDTPTRCFIRAHAEIEPELISALHVDTFWIRSVPPDSWLEDGRDRVFLDRWGVPWRRRHGQPYYELDRSPLRGKDYRSIEHEQWRPLLTDSMVEQMRRQAGALYRQTQLSLSTDAIGAGIFERAWYLKGFEELLMDMMACFCPRNCTGGC
jgi:uroporphyrinogen decarboxylase